MKKTLFLKGIIHLVRTQNFPKTNISPPLIRTKNASYVSFSDMQICYFFASYVCSGYIQLLRLYLGERQGRRMGGFDENANACKQGEGDYVNVNVYSLIFLIQYLVHKLLVIITRFFVFSSKRLSFLICLFVFSLFNWITEFPLKKAAFTRINIWIYIKVSMTIFSKLRYHPCGCFSIHVSVLLCEVLVSYVFGYLNESDFNY